MKQLRYTGMWSQKCNDWYTLYLETNNIPLWVCRKDWREAFIYDHEGD